MPWRVAYGMAGAECMPKLYSMCTFCQDLPYESIDCSSLLFLLLWLLLSLCDICRYVRLGANVQAKNFEPLSMLSMWYDVVILKTRPLFPARLRNTPSANRIYQYNII